MPNIYQQPDRSIFRFELYNLNFFKNFETEISGHYTFWYHLPTRSYVFCKHGDYANLVSIRPVQEEPHFPNTAEAVFLDSLVIDTMRHAYYYSGERSCNRGAFVFAKQEAATCKGERGFGTEYFKHRLDEYFSFIMKKNCVFEEHDFEVCISGDLRRKTIVAGKLFAEKSLTS